MTNKELIRGLYESFASGDTVVADGKYTWNHKTTGAPCEVRMAHIWTLADGKATTFLQHVDTARVRDLIA